MLRLLLKSGKLQLILNFVGMLHCDYNSKCCDWVFTFFFNILGKLCQPLLYDPYLALKGVCSNLMFMFLHAVWKADLATKHQPLLLLPLITVQSSARLQRHAFFLIFWNKAALLLNAEQGLQMYLWPLWQQTTFTKCFENGRIAWEKNLLTTLRFYRVKSVLFLLYFGSQFLIFYLTAWYWISPQDFVV